MMNDLIEERDKSMGRESEKSVEGERERERELYYVGCGEGAIEE